ncbi:MAG TPA: hypothetical protein VFN11_05720 [Ktedonobacterales bacterium]|nr:hypothetical protein [Ktedonobacterales bacterium]
MSRGKSPAGGEQAEAAGKLLRELAERAERDPAFGAQVAAAVRASGLLDVVQTPEAPQAKSVATPKHTRADISEIPDPFHLFRQHGDAGLRARLEQLDIAALRQIVRAHRLDPARISARWTNRDRVVALIVDQVRARSNHGRAFERV